MFQINRKRNCICKVNMYQQVNGSGWSIKNLLPSRHMSLISIHLCFRKFRVVVLCRAKITLFHWLVRISFRIRFWDLYVIHILLLKWLYAVYLSYRILIPCFSSHSPILGVESTRSGFRTSCVGWLNNLQTKLQKRLEKMEEHYNELYRNPGKDSSRSCSVGRTAESNH